ncbi:MAG: hypothetical protein HY304_04320 [candidate division Zixibacteria bacterium]|nr:hypothetical protein [candidate division Zixibacteria bacterium]
MKRFTLIACCLALVLSAAPAMAVNSVVVESRAFGLKQVACSVGVFLTNDVDILAGCQHHGPEVRGDRGHKLQRTDLAHIRHVGGTGGLCQP